MKLLGDNIVTILNTVKNLTQPYMLNAINNAISVYKKLDIEIEENVSYFQLFKRMNTPEVRNGIVFGMKFLKNLASTEKQKSFTKINTVQTHRREIKMGTDEFIGNQIKLDKNGHMKNFNKWNEEIAKGIAKLEGLEELTDRHWIVIDFMRNEYQAKGDAPSIRKLIKESGVETKELYKLFPKGPAKKAAKIAGLPKPKGCI